MSIALHDYSNDSVNIVIACYIYIHRLHFLSSAIDVFSDRLMLCPAASKIAFCNGCVRYYILYSNYKSGIYAHWRYVIVAGDMRRS